jgi:hypothetical protein
VYTRTKKEVFYWKLKEWKITGNLEAENQRKKMVDWCEENKHRYEIRQVFIKNAWAVEYRDLVKL